MKRYVLFAFGILLLTTMGAGAYFTGQTQVADNVVSAGSVTVSAEPTSAALSIEGIAPGQTSSRRLTVANAGSLPCDMVVTAAKKAGITAFYEALRCRVTAGGRVLYEGPLSALRTAPISMAPGQTADLWFSIGLPSDAGNDLAKDYAKFTVYVDAEQTH